MRYAQKGLEVVFEDTVLNVRCEVSKKLTVWWVLTWCQLADGYQCFKEIQLT